METLYKFKIRGNLQFLKLKAAGALCLLLLFSPGITSANHIEISNVTLTDQNYTAGTNHTDNHTYIEFDLEWENSWRNDLAGSGQSAPYNYDAAWVFAKFRKKGDTTWHHIKLNDSHLVAPAGAVIDVPPEQTGAFVYRDSNGTGTFQVKNARFRWNYVQDGVSDYDDVNVTVLAIEMVYIPEGSFYLGDGSTSNIRGHFHDATDSTQPYQVTSEAAITLGGTAQGNLGNHNGYGQLNDLVSDPDDWNESNPVILPAAFPKGFQAFYMMKYPITNQQYVDFLNMVPSSWATNLWRGSDYLIWRYDITNAGGTFTTNLPHVQKNFLSYSDGAAYSEWSGLRPMTEFEFEKAARGPIPPVAGEFAWGTATITPVQSLQNSGTENEAPSNHSSNAVWDQNLNPEGPVRAGMFATSNSDRVSSGASYYGVMHLTCTNVERVVSTGRPEGRLFAGSHGDGELYNANHTQSDWPGLNSIGIGYKGLHWYNWTKEAGTVSAREQVNNTRPDRYGAVGFRAVRTAP